ncbi:MAG: hypothetical protein GY792_18610, partial [Gammaproteobacteria bacterium]|nr:hypothetical protein [Gammaproteobacteria bacterium]
EPVPQGMFVQWADPVNTEPVFYRLYRASGTQIPSVEGLTPVIPEIPAEYMADGIVDPNPSTTEPCYVITAVDGVGNESSPSNSDYHNVGLLPVSSLHVIQQDDQAPLISWTHPSPHSIAIYDIYLGAEEALEKLNQGLLTAQSYTDTGYAGDERRYTVIALDANLQESLGRSITLPKLSISQPVTLSGVEGQ